MAIKAGRILHIANNFVVDRIQTGGPGNLNIPQERVYEVGNYQTVGIVRDTPELTFSLDSYNVDTEVEGLLTGSADPTADVAGTKYDLAVTKSFDVVSHFKSPDGAFAGVKGVAIPALTLESASYRFGMKENAGQQFSLRGDSLFYVPGTPYRQVFTGDGTENEFTLTNTALKYVSGAANVYALSVTVDGKRLTFGDDYTNTATMVTLADPPANGAKVVVVYGSATGATFNQSVHQGTSVKPAAIRGRDIDVYFSTDPGGGPVEVRWDGVQSANVDWRVSLEEDWEFGNKYAVTRDYTDVPEVSGSVEIRPYDLDSLFTRLRQITGVASSDVIGPDSVITGALRIVLRNPESGGSTGAAAGTVLKTLYVPAAEFTLPGYEARVQQKFNLTMNFTSKDGVLEVYKGAKP